MSVRTANSAAAARTPRPYNRRRSGERWPCLTCGRRAWAISKMARAGSASAIHPLSTSATTSLGQHGKTSRNAARLIIGARLRPRGRPRGGSTARSGCNAEQSVGDADEWLGKGTVGFRTSSGVPTQKHAGDTRMSASESGQVAEIVIAPLRKKTGDGKLYARDPGIEALLVELSTLSRDDLIERALISRPTDPRYVPSECLVYFVRASRSEPGEAWFERLYRILAARVLRCLPKPAGHGGETASLTREAVRDDVFGRFVELLSTDRHAYAEKLDYFEIRFDGALANLRRDAQRRAWREESRTQSLEYDESGELSPEIEEAAGSYDPFVTSDLDDATYRLRLEAAIDALPAEQRRIIQLLSQGFPIDSKEADVMTIAQALGRSEKTVRTYRDKAFATLRTAMNAGEGR